MRKKITALTVVFSLIIAMFAGGLQTFAAGADDISITGLVSDSATAQKFRIDNQTNRQIECGDLACEMKMKEEVGRLRCSGRLRNIIPGGRQ